MPVTRKTRAAAPAPQAAAPQRPKQPIPPLPTAKVYVRLGNGCSTYVTPTREIFYAKDPATGTSIARNYGSELQLNAFVSYRDLWTPGSFVGLGLYNLTNAATVLIQPYDNGHPPLPGPSRELFLRVGYDPSRKAQVRAESSTP